MKPWAEQFYNSKSWHDCRDAYLNMRFNLCERCGEPAKIAHHKTYLTAKNIGNPDIALSWDNLEALCQECHNKEHHRNVIAPRYKFDSAGNISPP